MYSITHKSERWHFFNLPMYSQSLLFDNKDNRSTPDGFRPCFRRHMHSETEFLYITGGSMHIEAGCDRFVASEGDLLIFNRFEPHHGWLDADCPFVEYSFLSAELSQLQPAAKNDLFGELVNSDAGFVRTVRDEESGRLLCTMPGYWNTQRSDAGAELSMLGNFYRLLGRLSELGCIQRANTANALTPAFVIRMIEFIERNYAQPITSQMIAEEFPYTQSYFCRLFKRHFGKPFYNYLEEYRIKRAIGIYENSPKDVSIADVAAKVGFSDYCRFSHSFRKIVGRSPTQYFSKSNARAR